jgi:3-hydroxyisobutyrate dehydrogenase
MEFVHHFRSLTLISTSPAYRFYESLFYFYLDLNIDVGVLGLGLMGSQLAMRLISAGYRISVYNRNDEKTKQFEKVNIKIARSPQALAENCDFILICVTNFEAVKKVCFGPYGIIAANRKDLVVADSSTISPIQSKYNAEALRKNEIEMLGMPLMGGPAAARDGKLVSIVAGNKDAFEMTKPIIQEITSSIFYIGNTDGSANALKLALNLNIALIAAALVEGITLVRGSGIDPAIFIKILNSTYFKTGLSEIKGPKMLKNNFEPSFHLKNMVKDLELIVNTAQYTGVSLPLAAIAQQIYRAANNSGFSDYDYTAILAFMEKINGIRCEERN